jgi:hypothetical protein
VSESKDQCEESAAEAVDPRQGVLPGLADLGPEAIARLVDAPMHPELVVRGRPGFGKSRGFAERWAGGAR